MRGNSWASTFLDTFRYLNQLGSVAQRGVDVVMPTRSMLAIRLAR